MTVLARFETADVDALDVHAARPVYENRPWVALNMVTSVDGASSLLGRSGGLGNDADRAVFRLLRSAADVVLVAAGTARAEHYGPVKLDAGRRAQRAAAGRPQVPPLAVVSANLSVDPDASLFVDAEPRTILVTTDKADTGRFDDRAVVVRAGAGTVDLPRALGELKAAGHDLCLCEGGPSLNAALLSAGLVDELCLTIAPLIAANGSPLLYGTPMLPEPEAFDLVHVLAAGNHLLLRYVGSDHAG